MLAIACPSMSFAVGTAFLILLYSDIYQFRIREGWRLAFLIKVQNSPNGYVWKNKTFNPLFGKLHNGSIYDSYCHELLNNCYHTIEAC